MIIGAIYQILKQYSCLDSFGKIKITLSKNYKSRFKNWSKIPPMYVIHPRGTVPPFKMRLGGTLKFYYSSFNLNCNWCLSKNVHNFLKNCPQAKLACLRLFPCLFRSKNETRPPIYLNLFLCNQTTKLLNWILTQKNLFVFVVL